MLEIRKVTDEVEPKATCLPNITCMPSTQCLPASCLPASYCTPANGLCIPRLQIALKTVSGTYRSPNPSQYGAILELRVDVDGSHPLSRVSGDLFTHWGFFGHPITLYRSSFIVEALTITEANNEAVITGPIKYYADPSNVNDTISIQIPRVAYFQPSPDVSVRFYTSGSLTSSFLCPKISEFFRTVNLEIDRFQGTTFPPTADTHAGTHPADLPQETLTTAETFHRAGIDMKVTEDDILNDSDSSDPGTNWDESELHDLMEQHFDAFANVLQWNLYGVVVPRFGYGSTYDSGSYGVMFDWGGWQQGDTYLRQGVAVAYDAIMGRSGTLYDTAAEKNRLFLETFVHEVGHGFNLPHTWSQTVNPSYSSRSFMNYPWFFTTGEADFWSNFRWEFDDDELVWMRHQDRNDVIFGGRDWIGNNLSIYTDPEIARYQTPLSLEVRARKVYDFAEPVQIELRLKNQSNMTQMVDARLEPEDGQVILYIQRPNGDYVRYVPPVHRSGVPNCVELPPNASLYESIMLSYGAKGLQFAEPGEYRIRAYFVMDEGIVISDICRLRVGTPLSRNSEELAHLLFSPEAAKFMYLGGSGRYPETVELLIQATEKNVETDPIVIRHLHAALGLYRSRNRKHVVLKDGKRVVTVQKADIPRAVKHLESALELLPTTNVAALDNITYNRVASALADVYQKQHKPLEAVRVLRDTLSYFEKRNVVEGVLKDYRARINNLSKKKS